MSIKDDITQCDDCGFSTPYEPNGWSNFYVKPKGIPVTLDMCPKCTEKRRPKPEPVHVPKLEDCLTPYQVTGYLLWCSGHLIDVHLPTKRSAIVTVKECDTWHVMDIYEDTPTGKAQLLAVVDYLANMHAKQWEETLYWAKPTETIKRVKNCSEIIFNRQLSSE